MNEPTVSTDREIQCKNCGAPLAYLQGEAVLHCAYCGSVTMLAGFDQIVRVETHYVLPVGFEPAEIETKVRDWLGQGFWKAADLAQRAVTTSLEGVVLPFWVVKTRAQTFWSGMDKRTRSVGSGSNKRSETYRVPTSGDFSDEYNWTVYAREDEAEYWGLRALNQGARAVEADWGMFPLGFGTGSKTSNKSDLLVGAEPFDLAAVDGLKVINGQIAQQRAELRGQSEIVHLHRRLAESKVDRVTDCDTKVDVLGCDLVYLPLYRLTYRYHARSYRLLLNAHSGEVIAGQAPVGKWDKVVMLSIVMGVLAAACSLIAVLAEAPQWWIGTGVAAGAVGLHALWTGLLRRD